MPILVLEAFLVGSKCERAISAPKKVVEIQACLLRPPFHKAIDILLVNGPPFLPNDLPFPLGAYINQPKQSQELFHKCILGIKLLQSVTLCPTLRLPMLGCETTWLGRLSSIEIPFLESMIELPLILWTMKVKHPKKKVFS